MTITFHTLASGLRYWESAGAGPTTTWLLVHGVGTSSDYWLQISPHLPEHVQVIAFDLPGSGETPPAPVSDDFAALASTTLDLVRPLIPVNRKVVIAGHSLGALVATEMARRDPRIADALVLVDPVLFQAETVLTNLKAAVCDPTYTALVLGQLAGVVVPGTWSAQILRARGMRRLALRHQLGAGPDINPAVLDRCLAHTHGWPRFRPADVIRAAHTVHMASMFSALNIPVSVVKGKHDPLTSAADFTHLAQLCDLRRLLEIPLAGHSPMLNLPGELVESIAAATGDAA